MVPLELAKQPAKRAVGRTTSQQTSQSNTRPWAKLGVADWRSELTGCSSRQGLRCYLCMCGDSSGRGASRASTQLDLILASS